MSFILLLNDYWESITAFGLFSLLHSIGAQEPCKNLLARCFGRFFVDHFWRIIYCVLSFAALYYGIAAFHWARNPANDVWLIDYPDWLWQAIVALHLLSIGVVYVAFLQSDYFEFLGLKQAANGIGALLGGAGGSSEQILFGTDLLVVTGIYGWVRHPMLIGGLLFMLTSGPSLNNLVYTAMYTAYMLIGGYYEERRMVRIFGEDYLRYRRRVGAFIPRLRRQPAE